LKNIDLGEPAMRYDLLRRFFAKLIHDVLPAALASLIGGFVLTHYGLGYYGFGRPPEPPALAATQANNEMMGVLRDEHALVLNYLKAQIAKEKQNAELAATRDDASARAGDAAAVAQTSVVAPVRVAAAKPASTRGKVPVVGAPLAPLVIADEQQIYDAKASVHANDSLLAKTLGQTIGLKDHVIAATQRAVSVIGGIPSWFGSIGDRIGGGSANPRPPAELVSTS
jgi:hypothetical protein